MVSPEFPGIPAPEFPPGIPGIRIRNSRNSCPEFNGVPGNPPEIQNGKRKKELTMVAPEFPEKHVNPNDPTKSSIERRTGPIRK